MPKTGPTISTKFHITKNKPALFLFDPKAHCVDVNDCPLPVVYCTWCADFDRAGGLSALASSIADSVLSGDFFTAKKLGFAQQIVSG